MKKLLLIAALVAAPVFAQAQQAQQQGAFAGSQSNSSASTTATSASTATSDTSNNQQVIQFNQPETQRSVSINKQSGELDTTPDVMAPALNTFNPCVYASSVGLSITGFGIGGGTTFKDEDCETRNIAGLLHQMGFTEQAMELLCQNAKVRTAFAAAAHNETGPRCRTGGELAKPAVAKGAKSSDGRVIHASVSSIDDFNDTSPDTSHKSWMPEKVDR